MSVETIESRIGAVTVSYNPDLDDLRHQQRALGPQVQGRYIIDNGSSNQAGIERLAAETGAILICLGQNAGIAHAQNVGIEAALAAGATHILLLDQDSIPFPEMTNELLQALQRLGTQSQKVAAISGLYADQRTKRRSWFFRERALGDGPNPLVSARFLIASGMLISAQAIRDVGLMNAELFIDHVDTEWCCRARHRGYILAGLKRVLMHHRLGDESITYWLGRWRQFPVHAPLRHYYLVRNSLWLLRLPHVDRDTSIRVLLRTTAIVFVSMLLLPRRCSRFKSCLSGLWAGLNSRIQ